MYKNLHFLGAMYFCRRYLLKKNCITLMALTFFDISYVYKAVFLYFILGDDTT